MELRGFKKYPKINLSGVLFSTHRQKCITKNIKCLGRKILGSRGVWTPPSWEAWWEGEPLPRRWGGRSSTRAKNNLSVPLLPKEKLPENPKKIQKTVPLEIREGVCGGGGSDTHPPPMGFRDSHIALLLPLLNKSNKNQRSQNQRSPKPQVL